MSFEEFLIQRFIGDGNSDMDMFYDWAADLPIENIIELSEEWNRQEIKHEKEA